LLLLQQAHLSGVQLKSLVQYKDGYESSQICPPKGLIYADFSPESASIQEQPCCIAHLSHAMMLIAFYQFLKASDQVKRDQMFGNAINGAFESISKLSQPLWVIREMR